MAPPKGISNNPSGRPAMPAEVRALIKENAGKGAERLKQLLDEDQNWHRRSKDGKFIKGELSGKEQIALAALAMDRGYGRAETVSISHTHSGTVGMTVNAERMRQIAERLPERLAQQRAIDADIVDAKIEEVEG